MNDTSFDIQEKTYQVDKKMTGPVETLTLNNDEGQQINRDVNMLDGGMGQTPKEMYEAEQKTIHRMTEKHRKLKINEQINRFLEILPSNGQNVKLSKNQILEKTYVHLTQLQDKCNRYMTMDPAALLEDRIKELAAENERLRKENDCFLEIFKTLNIQPSGLLEMNDQLKSVMKKEREKAATQIANSLISPNQGSLNFLLSPTGQDSSSLQGNQQGTNNLVGNQNRSAIPQNSISNNTSLQSHATQSIPHVDMNSNNGVAFQGDIHAGNQEESTLQNHSSGDQTVVTKKVEDPSTSRPDLSDVDEMLKKIIEGSDNDPNDGVFDGDSVGQVMNESNSFAIDPGAQQSGGSSNSIVNNMSGNVTTEASIAGASTHQPSATSCQALPTATTAATYPTTMVSKSISAPVVTSTSVSTTQSTMASSQPAQVQQGMKLVIPANSGLPQQNVIVPQIPQQQVGQTLFLTLPGRPNQLIPVRITPAPQRTAPPAILPNQGQSGNLANQLNIKRRQLKIKDQKKEITPTTVPMQPQFIQTGVTNPAAPQTVTFRLPVSNAPQSNIVMNQQGQMVLQQQQVQQTLQPVVINTGNGQQQTVYMQMPVQVQQPSVPQQTQPVQQQPVQQQPVQQQPAIQPAQQNQQVVYIQQNGQVIPVVVQNPQQQQQQGQPVQQQIQQPQQPLQQQQQQHQPIQQTSVMMQPQVQPQTFNAIQPNVSQQNQGNQNTTQPVSAANTTHNQSQENNTGSAQQNEISQMLFSSQQNSAVTSHAPVQNVYSSTYVHGSMDKTRKKSGHHELPSLSSASVGIPSSDVDSSDILATAAMHIFSDPSLSQQTQNDDNSSTQDEESSHKSKKKKVPTATLR